jgi:hypothetical protein
MKYDRFIVKRGLNYSAMSGKGRRRGHSVAERELFFFRCL